MAAIASPLLQRRKESDEEQLLKLFWNRAELKKELAKLRREKDSLVDQLRQQEAVNLRAQQRLEQLETLLADPVQSVSTVIYYQLRGIWQQCRKRLLRVARDLGDRQHERERQHAQAQFEQRRSTELALVDDKLTGLKNRIRLAEADLRTVQEKLRQLRGFWNYFRRRAFAEQGEAVKAVLDGLQTQIARLKAARQEKELETAPAIADLSIEGRRNINLAIVAMAQQLLLHFAHGNIGGLAREAAVRGLADVSYGSPADCKALGGGIETAVRKLDATEKVTSQTRRRAEFLKRAAHYRRDTDTVPVASSFSSVPIEITATGEPRPVDGRVIPVNVLADEYWDIYSVLLN